ncbi:MAG: hypothetical protein KDD36_08095 [Flavobacteriales bacterium]|nr:hypothetical protein [Flavobacteriales bacterium]
MSDIFYAIGDFLTWTFSFLQAADNVPNNIFIVVCFIFMGYWVAKMAGYEKNEAK